MGMVAMQRPLKFLWTESGIVEKRLSWEVGDSVITLVVVVKEEWKLEKRRNQNKTSRAHPRGLNPQ